MHEMVHYAWHGIDEGWCHVSIGVQSVSRKSLNDKCALLRQHSLRVC